MMADIKIKTEDEAIQYFKNFLSDDNNKALIYMLRAVLVEIGSGLARSSVFFLRVKAANANSCTSFKKATVDAELHRKGSFPQVAPLALFFVRGYAILQDFLDKTDPKIPENLAECRALRDLLQFHVNDKEQSVLTEQRGKCRTESKASLAIRLVQHLLIPLVPHKTFKIDSIPDLPYERCCSNEHLLNGTKGDTSFGCPRGWHGRADILLCDEVPFTFIESQEDSGDSDAVSLTSDSSVEVKRDENFIAESISQVTAQTIVYSFVQHRKNPVSQTSLTPGIGICSEKMILYLYDCVEDILLTSGPVDLYARLGGCSLNARAVIILWLVLNHNLFGNKTPDKYITYTAAFHHVLGPVQLEAYKNESEQPLRTKLDEEDLLKCLNEETASCQDDITEYIPERKSVSLK